MRIKRRYDGGGLYRHVRLLLTPAVHLSASGGASSTRLGFFENSTLGV